MPLGVSLFGKPVSCIVSQQKVDAN
jgi:hypothetical protein